MLKNLLVLSIVSLGLSSCMTRGGHTLTESYVNHVAHQIQTRCEIFHHCLETAKVFCGGKAKIVRHTIEKQSYSRYNNVLEDWFIWDEPVHDVTWTCLARKAQ